LDNKTLSRLEAAVSKSQYVGQGKKLKVTNKVYHPSSTCCAFKNINSIQVNSDILGGLIVEIGDRTIDLSVSARVAKMNKLLGDTL
jgi:F-type H+-transporting ATPase subunit O